MKPIEFTRRFVGGPDEAQPDWRKSDPDDEIDNNDDPSPISDQILSEILGVDMSEIEPAAETAVRKARATKAK